MIRKVLIAGLAIGLAFAGSVCAQSNNNGPKIANLGYLTVGPAFFDLDELNDTLQNRGLQDFSNTAFSVGLGNYAMIQRVLLDLQINTYWWGRNTDNGTKSSFWAANGLVNIGLNLLPSTMDLQAYPMVGIGLGALRLHVRPETSTFAEALTPPTQGVNPLWMWTMILNFGGGIDYLASIGPVQRVVIGIRGGYMYDPTDDSDWEQLGTELSRAPETRMSNAYVYFTIGKGLSYNMWQRLSSVWK